MRKAANRALIIFMGIVAFAISLYLDMPVNSFFNNLNFQIFDFILVVITNFAFVSAAVLLLPSIVLHKEPKKAMLFWITFISSVILSFAIKLIVSRQRPEEILSYPFIGAFNFSFPSMHTAVVFAALPLLICFIPKQKTFWIFFAFLVAFTRIYFGFHFLSDVVFGGFFGYILGGFIIDLHLREKI